MGDLDEAEENLALLFTFALALKLSTVLIESG